MIDTIQVEIPMIHFDILTSELGYLFRDNPDVVIAGLLSPVTGEFSPFSSTQMSELASNERKVMVRVNISQDYIQVQFSLPKFILGTNAVEYSNLLLGLYHFRQFIAERLGIIEEDLGDPKFWNLTRLDLCKNIDCQTQSFRDAILFRLQKQAHNAFIRKKKSLIFQTSVYLPSSYHTLKWYLKYEEYVNTQRKGDQKKEQKNLLPKDFSKTVEEYSKPILRFEIELRRAALQNKVFGYIYSQNEKTKHIAQNKALDLIDQCEIPIKIKLWAMNRYKRSEYTLFVDYMLKELSLEKILWFYMKKFTMNLPTNMQTKDTIWDILRKKYTLAKSERLLGFLQNLDLYGKKGMYQRWWSKYYVSRAIKDLREAGVSLILSEKKSKKYKVFLDESPDISQEQIEYPDFSLDPDILPEQYQGLNLTNDPLPDPWRTQKAMEERIQKRKQRRK